MTVVSFLDFDVERERERESDKDHVHAVGEVQLFPTCDIQTAGQGGTEHGPPCQKAQASRPWSWALRFPSHIRIGQTRPRLGRMGVFPISQRISAPHTVNFGEISHLPQLHTQPTHVDPSTRSVATMDSSKAPVKLVKVTRVLGRTGMRNSRRNAVKVDFPARKGDETGKWILATTQKC